MAFLDNDGVTRLTRDYLDIFARKEDAVLDPSGGLIRTDDGIRVDSLVQESDGEVSGAIAELIATGHAEQFSTTGKNLLPNNIVSETRNGITFTVNADGSISVKGTSSEISRSSCRINLPLTQGTYTLGKWVTSMTNQNVNAAILVPGDTSKTRIATLINNSTITFTVDTSVTYTEFAIYVPASTTVDAIFYPQVEAGSTATEYEPYTGGAPSPSPDYPQEIQVVRGRNLLDLSSATSGYIDNNGVAQPSTVGTVYSELIPVKSGKYILHGTIGIADISRCVHGYDSSGNWVSQLANNAQGSTGSQYSIAFIVPSGVSYVRCVVNNADTAVQLELGSTPTPYVPYGYVGMEIQGKNLLLWSNPSSENIERIGKPNSLVYVVEDGRSCYKIAGPATSGAQYASENKNIVQLKANTQYTYSALVKLTTTGSDTSTPLDFTSLGHFSVSNSASTKNDKTHEDVASARIYSPNRVTIGEWTKIQITFTTNSLDGSYFGVFPKYSLGDSFTIFICNQQLELGTEATPYEPYCNSTTPIPLPSRGWVGSLPDGTADTLTLDGAGKVTWEEKVKSANLPNDTWSLSETGTSRLFGRSKLTFTDRENTERSLNLFCSHFRLSTSVANFDNSIVFYKDYWVDIRADSIASNNDFSAFLQSNPVTVLYPLATPVTEDCGYVDMPAIPSDATVTIPELDALGIKYLVDDSSNALAKQLHERIDTETDEKIAVNNDIVESNIAMIESSTAKSNHAVGSYFMLDNVLHKATSAIASGETITSGSNATPITLAQAILALNNSVANDLRINVRSVLKDFDYTIGANENLAFGASFDGDIPLGYQMIYVEVISYGGNNLTTRTTNHVLTNNSVTLFLHNNTGSPIESTLTAQAICIKVGL